MNTQNTQNPSQSVHVVIPTVKPVITYAILGVLVMIFVYASNQPDYNAFALRYAISNGVYDGEYYRLFTAMFMHADDTHLISNAFSLFVFGRYVESVYGHWRFALIYLLGGLAGSVASLIYTIDLNAPVYSLGASGAIFAIFVAMAIFYYHHSYIFGAWGRQRIIQLAIFALVFVILGALPELYIDNAGHIGGLVGGFILAWFICPQIEIRGLDTEQPYVMETNPVEKWAIVPVLFSIALVLIVILFVGVS